MAEAEASYQRSLEILDGLAREDPTGAVYQTHRIQALKGLGASQRAGGRTADAVASWRRALLIGEALPKPYLEAIVNLAGCHALLGGCAGEPGSGMSLAQGTNPLDRAMATLHRAVAAGLRSAEWIRADTDLDPLRGREDFKLLMMDLAMPKEPFADSK
jgi:hypothetical protein